MIDIEVKSDFFIVTVFKKVFNHNITYKNYLLSLIFKKYNQ